MKFNLFLNLERKIRNIWWVVIFFIVLTAITLPVILLSVKYYFEVTMYFQAVIVWVVTIISQLLRTMPLVEVIGTLNVQWIKSFFIGLITGAVLMLFPAFILWLFGVVYWEINAVYFSSIFNVTLFFVAVAIAEELLFRGFIFQRMINGIGQCPAQVLIGALFLLTHLNNPGMTGSVKMLAGANIFLASIMFGLAFIRTKSLSMSIGLHLMANWVQGVLLGFGVSGNEETSLFKPVFKDAPNWLTGGKFGLEASIPGLITVIITIILLYHWNPNKPKKINYHFTKFTIKPGFVA